MNIEKMFNEQQFVFNHYSMDINRFYITITKITY